ncbi:3'-5' exonuclease [Antarcticirhabdus aurantiaca]|uniref:3'-5' exonuclease n=1 Tax=Antarcticirhabdus aurantiaca TaxID=2606717 RepID=A0ACD4NNF0_9HYPH|nr:3'-5' exonuclease [Antarcticirhabdus aurantiaca]WAJ28407.1 3'-5' exonuclease [Jeongeuplla avenae]
MQADLFRSPLAAHSAVAPPPRLAEPRAGAAFRDEALARRLERTGRFRVLRRLEPRPAGLPAGSLPPAGMRVGVVLDTETTGLDRRTDEVVEIGMVSFTFDEDFRIHDVVDVFGGLREPSIPMPPEVTRLTGITPEMLAGRSVDARAVADFVAPASIVVAHNARFDRPFCEKTFPGFEAKPWACSVAEVPWRAIGYESSRLEHLVNRVGLFHDGHRAVDDCHALLEVLAVGRHDATETPFQTLMRSASRTRVEISAEKSPFQSKDLLKQRGYRWSDGSDGRSRCWRTEVDEDEVEAELRFLRERVYRAAAHVPCRRMGAADRYR